MAIDGSVQSYNALTHAVAIAEKFGSELKIVTVVPHQYYYGDINESSHMDKIFFKIQDNLLPVYNNILVNAEAKVRSDYPDLDVTAILMEGRPSVKIVELAEKEGCDLIIMGCRGLSGIIGLLEESTSHSVIDKSKIPVMIIK